MILFLNNNKYKQMAYPNPNDYSSFMGNFSSATGATTLIMMLLGRTIFEKFGWRKAALVTPTVCFFCPFFFFHPLILQIFMKSQTHHRVILLLLFYIYWNTNIIIDDWSHRSSFLLVATLCTCICTIGSFVRNNTPHACSPCRCSSKYFE